VPVSKSRSLGCQPKAQGVSRRKQVNRKKGALGTDRDEDERPRQGRLARHLWLPHPAERPRNTVVGNTFRA
jgi:hypothetical protein